VRAVLAFFAAVLAACSPRRDAPRPATIAISPAPDTPPSVSVPAPAPEPAPAPPPRSAAVVAVVLSQIRDLHRLLEHHRVTLGEVVKWVGPIQGEARYMELSVELRPRAPWMRQARVSRYPDGTVYLLEIDLVSEARPTIQDLRGIFGANERRQNRDLHGERFAIFDPPSNPPRKDVRSKVAVIASLPRCRDPHGSADPPPWPCTPVADDSLVERIEFQRDIH
jgi:hypothetical protein